MDLFRAPAYKQSVLLGRAEEVALSSKQVQKYFTKHVIMNAHYPALS